MVHYGHLTSRQYNIMTETFRFIHSIVKIVNTQQDKISQSQLMSPNTV